MGRVGGGRASSIGLLVLATCMSASLGLSAGAAEPDRPPQQRVPPVAAIQLLPQENRTGTYLVTQGPDTNAPIPFSYTQHDTRWILTKEGLTQHELEYDASGNVLILREVNFRTGQEIEYDPPVVLLPAMVDGETSLTGRSRVVVRNRETGSATHRGSCTWHVMFAGIDNFASPSGAIAVYTMRLTREVRLSIARMSLIVDFGYVLGEGIVATSSSQVIRVLGLLTDREAWSLERPLLGVPDPT